MKWLIIALAAVALSACERSQPDTPMSPAEQYYPSTYVAPDAAPVVIRNATILTGTGERLDGADIVLANGRIKSVGQNPDAPQGAREIDADGRWATPGLIDAHSHLGVYASPGVWANADGNEMTDPVTAEVWAEHALWPQDPGFEKALAGGVTSMLILPGSANLIGGRGVTVKNVPATSYQAMKFPGAPQALKMACGENPRRVYGQMRQSAPMTNMGNVAGYRRAFAKAEAYQRKREELAEGDSDSDHDYDHNYGIEKGRSLQMETLVGVLDGDIRVHNHCYRADEMMTMFGLADEFDFKITAFHHAVEAYKIADELAERGTCVATWADWWGFKLEAYDAIRENLAMVEATGGCAILHSDSASDIQRLNQEAAKAMAAGNRAGIDITPEQAIRWLTANPARALGIDDRTGTLEPGKQADVVLWSADPFSVYAQADHVFIDGVERHDRSNPPAHPRSDFMLGQPIEGVTP